MKLTYWVCEHLSDSQMYAIRTKTKREALARSDEQNAGMKEEGMDEIYGPPVKVVMEYRDAFEMMEACLCDTGINLIVNFKGAY